MRITGEQPSNNYFFERQIPMLGEIVACSPYFGDDFRSSRIEPPRESQPPSQLTSHKH